MVLLLVKVEALILPLSEDFVMHMIVYKKLIRKLITYSVSMAKGKTDGRILLESNKQSVKVCKSAYCTYYWAEGKWEQVCLQITGDNAKIN